MPFVHEGKLRVLRDDAGALDRRRRLEHGTSAPARSSAIPGSKGLQIDQLHIYEAGTLNKTLHASSATTCAIPNPRWAICASQIAACRLAVRRARRTVPNATARTRHGGDPDGFSAKPSEVPQRGRRHSRRGLRSGILVSMTTASRPTSRPHPCEGDGHGRRHDDRSLRLLRPAPRRHQLAHFGGRARRLQGADRAADAGQRRLVPRADVDHSRRQHHDGALSGADGRVEPHLPTVVDTIFGALAPAAPERIPAAHHGLLGGSIVVLRRDPATRQRFVLQSIEGGGWGGRPLRDGESPPSRSARATCATARSRAWRSRSRSSSRSARCAPIPAAPAISRRARHRNPRSNAGRRPLESSQAAPNDVSTLGPMGRKARTRRRHAPETTRRGRFQKHGRDALSHPSGFRGRLADEWRRRLGRPLRARPRARAIRRDRRIHQSRTRPRGLRRGADFADFSIDRIATEALRRAARLSNVGRIA